MSWSTAPTPAAQAEAILAELRALPGTMRARLIYER